MGIVYNAFCTTSEGIEDEAKQFIESNNIELIKQILLLIEFAPKPSVRFYVVNMDLSVPMRNLLIEHKVITRNTKTIRVYLQKVLRDTGTCYAIRVKNGQEREILHIISTPILKKYAFN